MPIQNTYTFNAASGAFYRVRIRNHGRYGDLVDEVEAELGVVGLCAHAVLAEAMRILRNAWVQRRSLL
jgi:hypothetical protein